MEIRATHNNQIYYFENISQGECFIDDDGDLMMKVEEIRDVNAVGMVDGCMYSFDDTSIVTPVKAVLEYQR